MSKANIITKEELDFIKLTTKIAEHPIHVLHLQAKTFNEILNDPQHIFYDLVKIKKSCSNTSGGFVGCQDSRTGYISFSTRYFETRKKYLMHRLIYMLSHSILLDEEQFINHIDGNTSNNSIDNLEIVSIAENSHIYRALGTQRLFEDHIPTADIDGNYSIYICIGGKTKKLCIGVSKDRELVHKLYSTIKEMRTNIELCDKDLINFIDNTKYRTLEDRFSLLKINVLQIDYKTLYDAIVDFNTNINSIPIRQTGVLTTRYGYYEVKIKINGKTVVFGSYGHDLKTANSVVLRIRELKNKNPELLLNIINSKPSGVLAKDYYLEHLFK